MQRSALRPARTKSAHPSCPGSSAVRESATGNGRAARRCAASLFSLLCLSARIGRERAARAGATRGDRVELRSGGDQVSGGLALSAHDFARRNEAVQEPAQGIEVEWLLEGGYRSNAPRGALDSVGPIARNHHDRHVAMRPKLVAQCLAVHPGKHQVQQHQRRGAPGRDDHLQPLGSIPGPQGRAAALLDDLHQQIRDGVIVLHDEDPIIGFHVDPPGLRTPAGRIALRPLLTSEGRIVRPPALAGQRLNPPNIPPVLVFNSQFTWPSFCAFDRAYPLTLRHCPGSDESDRGWEHVRIACACSCLRLAEMRGTRGLGRRARDTLFSTIDVHFERVMRAAEPPTHRPGHKEDPMAQATVESSSARVRARLDHPVVDADGHWLEPIPLFLDFLKEDGGQSAVDDARKHMRRGPWYQAAPEERIRSRITRPQYWALTGNTLDRATGMLPELLYRRLDDFGIDFVVLMPSLGGRFAHMPQRDLRRVCVRAYNRMAAELWRPYADRIAPVGVSPNGTPQEAIEE